MNADAVAAAMIVGAVLLVVVGAMLPDWAKVPGPATTWLPIAFYVFAALAVCLALYLRATIRKAQNSTKSTVLRRN